MSTPDTIPVAAIRQLIAKQFPGTIGIELVEATAERVLGRLPVTPSISAVGTFLNLPPGGTTTTIESSTRFMAAARTDDCAPWSCRPSS